MDIPGLALGICLTDFISAYLQELTEVSLAEHKNSTRSSMKGRSDGDGRRSHVASGKAARVLEWMALMQDPALGCMPAAMRTLEA